MDDPFVKRMMQRTKARQKTLARLIDNKENSLDSKSTDITYTKYENEIIPNNNLNNDDTYDGKTPSLLKPKNIIDEDASNSVSPPKRKYSSEATDLVTNNTFSVTQTKSGGGRLNKLKLVSQQMQEWEDDYTYHFVTRGDSKEVDSSSGVMSHESSLPENDNSDPYISPTKDNITNLNDLSTISSFNAQVSPLKCPLPNKYYYGEFVDPHNKNGEGVSCRNSLQNSNSPINLSKNTNKSKLQSISPTRQLAWDQKLLRSLEAQGFTPSDSRSKLSYDYAQDSSPVKMTSGTKPRGPHDYVRVNSPINKSPEKNKHFAKEKATVPPKIVSLYSKSPSKKNRDSTNDQNETRKRDMSPKVSDLRSRWEENIRNASPERNTSPIRSPTRKILSPSPTKMIKSPSPTRIINSPSPIKYDNLSLRTSRSEKAKIIESKTAISPTKGCSTLPRNTKRQDASVTSGSPIFLKKNYPISPTKSTSVTNIVKGNAPMPDVTPIIENSSSLSVRQKIAAFTSAMATNIPEKDPAEMSVQDILNIFEKKKGQVLIPKAPFGQPVPTKVLQSTKSSVDFRQVQISSQPMNKTYVCPKDIKEGRERGEKLDSKVSRNKEKSGAVSQPIQCKPDRYQFNSTVPTPKSKSFDCQRKQFENIDEEDWKSTDIGAKVMAERKHDMDVLLNRFKKPRHKRGKSHRHVKDSSTESDESSTESNVIESRNGPPKPSRTYEYDSFSPTKSLMLPPRNIHSPSKRLNSTELGESSPTKKEYVPRVKPGCLFPSLSDIESHSEAVDSQDDDDVKESSFALSVLTSASVDSLGKQIQKIAQPINPSSYTEGSTDSTKAKESSLMGDSAMEAIGEIDNALDEAFSDDVTPPKRSRNKDDDYNCGSYRTPKILKSTDSSDDSSQNLAHSISMYRKQKPAEVNYTPIRQIVRKPEIEGPTQSPISPSVNISERIRAIQEMEEMQLTVISQASSAINVVSQHPEQNGTPQHVEAEKLLLMATQKRQCALSEIQRMKAEGALGRKDCWPEDEDSCRGSISISNIALPLKKDFLNKEVGDDVCHHLLVLVKHRDQVITSQIQKTPANIVNGAITFPNLMSLHNLTADFNIALEVYCFKVQRNHNSKKDFKKEQSRLILTPLKRLQKESRSSPVVPSPGGPYAVRSSAFALVGFAHLNINTLTRNAWTLEKVPYNSPLDGHLLMRVSVTMEGGVTGRSFLTMFEDVGGFGAWNRRWCVLKGPFLKYWRYPDDETKQDCLGVLDLRICTTRKVELVSRDVCARQFTFELTLVRPARKNDKNDLVNEIKNHTVISRILLSADSREERILWCNKLNKALANIRAWDPDALKPEDFQV